MQLSPTLSGLIALLIWIFMATLVASSESMPPFAFSAISNFGSFIFFCLFWKIRKESIREKFKLPPAAYAVGIFFLGGYIILWIVGLKFAPPLEANLLNYIWPILIVIFSAIINKSPLRWHHLAGIALGFIGTAVLFLHLKHADFNIRYLIGYAAAFIGAFGWALYSVLTRRLAFPSDRVGIFFLFIGIFSALVSFSTENWRPTFSWSLLLAIVFAASRFSIFLWDYAMKRGDVVLITSFAYFTPLLSTLVLAIVTGGALTTPVLWASVLILGGCMITNSDQIRPFLAKLRSPKKL